MNDQVNLPDLKFGDCILFEDQKPNEQGHTVIGIFKPKYSNNIIVQCIPEWTPTRSYSMFHYGTKKFKKKYK